MKFQNDACLMANDKNTNNDTGFEVETTFERDIALHEFVGPLEPILSTRLSNETFCGLLNYAKETLIDATVAEIHTALVSSKC